MSRWREDPASVRPMLASLGDPPLSGPNLLFEPKYDGVRALVDLRPATGRRGTGHVRIYSRNGRDKTSQFPEVAEALGRVTAGLDHPLVVDGEIVAVDARDRPLGFQHVQGRIHITGAAAIAEAARQQPVVLVVFDLLRDGDEDVRGLPLAERRLRLQARLRPRGRVRKRVWLSEVALEDGHTLLARARREGWEGLIVKDGRSLYASGRRTPAWRKLKILREQEFVIGGWTDPRQTRQHFGAILVGYYDGSGLRYAGSVGTGFTDAELGRLARRFDRLAVRRSPFADVPKAVAKAHWIRPRLVAEVRFTEWTSDGLLRQPVYLGLRDDKPARQVVREDAPAAEATPRTKPAARRTRTAAKSPRSRPRQKASRGRRHASARITLPDASLADLVDALASLERDRRDGTIALPGGDTLRVTNLTKPFWPKLGITKGELLRYYATVAPLLLPAVEDRPLVMKRFPNGVDRQAFYQQKHPDAVPPGVRREVLPEDVEPADEDGPRDRLIGGSLTTLLYMTQLAAISQDPWFSRVATPFDQDYAAVDLDPGDGTTFDDVVDVALRVREVMDRYGVPGIPKTSGSRGLHIYIPLPAGTSYDTGQLLCQILATTVAEAHPNVATVERLVKRRPRGTVYVDYLQNILGKTLATAYSARASDYAGVSTPLDWSEVRPGLDPRAFTVRSAPDRFRATGDLWAALRDGPPVDLDRLLAEADG